MFNQLKEQIYPLNPLKFESLQYLDSIRAPEELKFQKIQKIIERLKDEQEEEDFDEPKIRW